MRTILAKAIYYVGVVSMVGLAIGMGVSFIWLLVTLIPYALFFILGLLAFTGFGLLFGWAERELDRSKSYTND